MKYKKEQSELISHLIVDSVLMHHTVKETIEYVEQHANVRISYYAMSHRRGDLRQEAEKEFNKLKKDRFEYQYQFMKRIHEIEGLQKRQWQQLKKTDDFMEQQNCFKELHQLTVTLANLYDLVPIIDQKGLSNVNAEQPQEIKGILQDPNTDPEAKF